MASPPEAAVLKGGAQLKEQELEQNPSEQFVKQEGASEFVQAALHTTEVANAGEDHFLNASSESFYRLRYLPFFFIIDFAF